MFKNTKMLWRVIRRLRFDKILLVFLFVYCIVALVIYWIEPGIDKVGDAFWYTFVACTSIGFGDVVVSTGLARVLTVIITINELFIVSLFSGVIVSYYLELIRRKENEMVAKVVDKLEHVSELSEEELKEIEASAKKLADL